MRAAPAVLVLVIAAAACGERLERSYRTYHDAVADGAIARGWLPAWLPPTATEIREWHDLDTNATHAWFTYGSAAPEVFLAPCSPAPPRNMPSQFRAGNAASALQFYRCNERVTFTDGRTDSRAAWVAIDRAAAKAYFWR